MSRAASLTVIAVGAIFAFAVTASPGFLNLQIVGWILMATGVAGLLLERRSRDWLRRTVIVRSAPDSRLRRRRPTQIASPPPFQRQGQPGEPPTEPIQTETVEEYIEP
jgi:hypothetical protein